MIRDVVRIARWLAFGAALVAICHWAFLETTEVNTFTLALSAFFLVLMVVTGAGVVNLAILLALGGTVKKQFGTARRHIGWCLLIALPIIAVVLGIMQVDAWVARHAGEIGAWFIARFGWADSTPVLRAYSYFSAWLRWVVLPLTGIAAMAAVFQQGRRGVATSRWLAAAWHWRTILVATVASYLCVVLPWRLAFWRPEGLPPTWVEPALAALKLAFVVVAMAVGAAVIVLVTVRAVAATPNAAEQSSGL